MRKNRLFFVLGLQHSRCMIVAGLLAACINAQAVTLEEAIESALKVDPTLRASKFNEMATEENIDIARSRLLPQISIQGASNQLTQTTMQDIVSGGRVSRSFTGPSVNHQFVIRQALLRPKELSALRFAELQTQFLGLKYKSEVNDLKFKVVNAWIDLLGAQQIAQAYERPLRLMQAASKQERAKYEQGDSTKDVAMEAEAQYEITRAAHVQAVETLKAKQVSFRSLTKIPAVALAKKKLAIQPLTEFTEANKAEHWVNFQDTSLEMQMAKLQEQLQNERIKMAEADHKPTLDFVAAVNIAQNDATSTQGYQYRNKQVGLQYTVPLYAGGGGFAAIKQAALGYEASLMESEAIVAKIANDFEQLWGQLVSSIARQKATFNSTLAGHEQVSSTARGYELGVKTLGDLSSAELALSRKIIDEIIANQDHYKTLAKLNNKCVVFKMSKY
jgi:outer membrane protein TolC